MNTMAQVWKVRIGHGADAIELRPGLYRKEAIAGENARTVTRMGTAHLTVEPSAVLHSTNRRGERQLDIPEHVFLRRWRSGMNRNFPVGSRRTERLWIQDQRGLRVARGR